MGEPFRTQRLVEFSDTDMAGIMHFAAFFRYMESAEHELLRAVGLSVHSLVDGQPLSFPRVAASCEYHAPARCEETLDVAIHILRIGEKSLTYQFAFSYEGRPVATGQMTSVCCQVDPGTSITSVPIPAEMASKLEAYCSC